MTRSPACADADRLQKLLLGRLPETESERVENHLLACAACLETFKSLQAADTLAQPLHREPDAAQSGAEDAESCAALIDRLKQLAPAATLVEAETPPNGLGGARPPDTDEMLSGLLAPPQGPGEIGRVGPYRVLKVLGAGGMGVVFLAEDPTLCRLLALKAMKPSLGDRTAARQRFLREAQATAALRHDHVVTVYQAGEDRGVLYLAMEFLEGESLEDRLKREGKLPVAEVLRVGREVAEGLAAAHARGLIHRDIKPANIWLEARSEFGIRNLEREDHPHDAASEFRIPNSEFKRVKILDLGLARALSSDEPQLTQSGAVLGTPAYMAPEQAQGQTVDGRCDLFSLGCVLYRICTGRQPFQGTSVTAVLLAVATEHPPAPRQWNPQVPAALSNLIQRLLAKNLPDRPAAAAAVVRAIRAMEQAPAGVASASRPVPAEAQAPIPANATCGSGVEARAGGAASRRGPRPMRTPARPGRRRGLLAAAALLAAALVPAGYFFGPTVIRIATNKGQLVIEDWDKDVQVVVTGPGAKIIDLKGKREVELTAADYEVEVKELPDGLRFATRRFSLTRGGKEVVNARLELEAKTGPDNPGRGQSSFATGPSLEKTKPIQPGLSPFDQLDPKDIPASERFGWQPPELVAVLGEHRHRHWGNIVSVVFSPDGKWVATLGSDKGCVWDVADGHERFAFKERQEQYRYTWQALAVSPDGRSLATTNRELGLRLWNSSTGHQRAVLGGGRVAVAFSPDGRKVASGEPGRIYVSDPVTEKTIELTGPATSLGSLAFSADSKLIFSAGTASGVRVWDLATQKSRPLNEEVYVNTVSASPDGKLLAYSGNSGCVLWDLAAAKKKVTLESNDSRDCSCLVFSPDSRTLAYAQFRGNGEVSLHNTALGKRRATFKHGGVSAAFSPDGKFLATGSGSALLLWDARAGEDIRTLDAHKGGAHAVAFSPDGKLLATAGADHAARIWDGASKAKEVAMLAAHTDEVYCVAWSPGRKLLATGGRDGKVILWDSATGKEEKVIPGHVGQVLSLAFAPDGSTLASASKDTTVKLWDVAAGKEIKSLPGHDGGVNAVAYSPDGRTIATGGNDQAVRLWNAASGQERAVLRGHAGPVLGVAFAPDGKSLASAGQDGTARAWQLPTKDGPIVPIPRFILTGHDGSVRCTAYAPDGKTLATGGDDGTVKLWLADSDQEWITLPGHTGPVNAVAFSPDGRTIASACQDGTVQVRRAAQSVPHWDYPPPSGEILDMTPDAKLWVSSRWDGTFDLLDIPSGKPRHSSLWALRPVRYGGMAPDGRTIACLFDTGKYSSLTHGGLWDILHDQERKNNGAERTSFAWGVFSQDGRTFLGMNGSVACVWDVETGKQLLALPPVINAGFGFAPDGKTLYMAGTLERGPADIHLVTWDLETRKERARLKIPGGWYYGPVFTPDGKTLVLWREGKDAAAALWDVAAGKERARLPVPFQSPVLCSPDGRTLAGRHGTDNTAIIVYNVATAEFRATLKGNSANSGFTFSPDGKLLASWDEDGRVALWDAATGQQLRVWPMPGACKRALFAPDSRHLVINNANETAYVLRLAKAPGAGRN